MRFAAVLLVGLAVLLPGAGRAQPANEYRIIAIGDFGVGGEFQRSSGEGVRTFEARNRSNLLLTLGDNDYSESPTAFRANWAGSFGWARRRGLAVAGVLGNHDARVQGGRYEFSTLGMRGRYYKRRAGPAELFLLDSNRVRLRPDVLAREEPCRLDGPLEDRRLPSSGVHLRELPRASRRRDAAGCPCSSGTASSSPCRATTTTTSGWALNAGSATSSTAAELALVPDRSCPAGYPRGLAGSRSTGSSTSSSVRIASTAGPSGRTAGGEITSSWLARMKPMAELGTMRVKGGLAEMLKGGVIMDVTTPSRR